MLVRAGVPLVGDPLDSKQAETVINTTASQHGRVDGVVNCVGSIVLKSAHTTSDADFDQVRGTCFGIHDRFHHLFVHEKCFFLYQHHLSCIVHDKVLLELSSISHPSLPASLPPLSPLSTPPHSAHSSTRHHTLVPTQTTHPLFSHFNPPPPSPLVAPIPPPPGAFANLQVMKTNLYSCFNIMRPAVKAMMKGGAGGGSIAFCSSAVSQHGIPNHEAIAAAKAGVVGERVYIGCEGV